MVEGTDGQWAAEAQSALIGFARDHVDALGAGGDRTQLEQALCFAAAVWNSMVLMEQVEDPFALAEIVGKIQALDEPYRSEVRAAMWDLAERKLTDYPKRAWVYRHLHVVNGRDGELRVRCEILTLADWLASGEPLRMGLVE